MIIFIILWSYQRIFNDPVAIIVIISDFNISKNSLIIFKFPFHSLLICLNLLIIISKGVIFPLSTKIIYTMQFVQRLKELKVTANSSVKKHRSLLCFFISINHFIYH